MYDRQYPLYHPELEHESCGVGAIVDLSGRATHRTVDQALSIVERLTDGFLADVTRKSGLVRSLLEGAPGIEGISGLGLMIGIKTAKPAADVVAACMENGVLCLTAKDKVRLLPALNIPEEVLARAIDVIKGACA